jgi:hypothetical protein
MSYENIQPLADTWANQVVSEGTLRNEDLAKAFLSLIGEHDNKIKDAILEDWEDVLFNMIDPKAERDYEQESFLLGHLFNVMDAISPEGCVFGASDSDGALFGFWQMEEAQ